MTSDHSPSTSPADRSRRPARLLAALVLIGGTLMAAFAIASPADAGGLAWRDDWVSVRAEPLGGSAPTGGTATIRISITNRSGLPVSTVFAPSPLPPASGNWQGTAVGRINSPLGDSRTMVTNDDCYRRWPTLDPYATYSYTCTISAGYADHDVHFLFAAQNPAGLDPGREHDWVASAHITIDPNRWVLARWW